MMLKYSVGDIVLVEHILRPGHYEATILFITDGYPFPMLKVKPRWLWARWVNSVWVTVIESAQERKAKQDVAKLERML